MKTEFIRLNQVSKLLSGAHNIPLLPKDGWLYSIRTALGMSVVTAAKRAGVTKAAWVAAEKRETSGTITIENLRKFLGALGYSFSYVPYAELSLEKILEKQALEFAKKELLNITSTMALENQAPEGKFSDLMVEKRTEDIIRNGNWKEIWQ